MKQMEFRLSNGVKYKKARKKSVEEYYEDRLIERASENEYDWYMYCARVIGKGIATQKVDVRTEQNALEAGVCLASEALAWYNDPGDADEASVTEAQAAYIQRLGGDPTGHTKQTASELIKTLVNSNTMDIPW